MVGWSGLDAVRRYWNDTLNRLACRVYADLRTHEVWACVYPSLSSWDDYHDEAVVCVLSHDDLPRAWHKLTKADLRVLASVCDVWAACYQSRDAWVDWRACASADAAELVAGLMWGCCS